MARSRTDGGSPTLRAKDITGVLIAPDSFKGSLTAREAAEAMGQGVADVLPGAAIVLHPVSDGGEGMLDVLLDASGGRKVETDVSGPLPGQRVRARWGISGDGTTAVIEMAEAAGVLLVPPSLRDPKVTTTFGVGELIRAALDSDIRSMIVGIGGSATNDGGAGMAEALGVRFLDSAGAPVARGGAALLNLAHIDLRLLDGRLREITMDVACDVRNPLTGPEGASVVFGPQKGASSEDAALLDQALVRYRECVMQELHFDVQSIPGSGAAGGLGAGLAAFCHARLRPGIDIVLDAGGFNEHLQHASMVITGEGSLDAQTKSGKAVSGILRRSVQQQRPVAAVVGSMEGTPGEYIGPDRFIGVASLIDGVTSRGEAMRDARRLLRRRTAELIRSIIQ